MHPVALPRPQNAGPAMVYYDDDAICFHVCFPWKPSNTGMTIGDIENLPSELRGCIFGLDTVEEVADAVEGIPFNLFRDGWDEVIRRGEYNLLMKAAAEQP